MKIMERKEALAEIREILEGIRDGKLRHEQTWFVTKTDCGTAYCVAGWKVVRDAGIKFRKIETMNIWCRRLLTESVVLGVDPWDYAEKAWGLSYQEAVCLFNSNLMLDELFTNLERMEQEAKTGSGRITG